MNFLGAMGWACFLACSWTWCIGMFLPVLLIRDFGLWSFAAFAIPNVVGAAAMGWVIRSRESSTTLVVANEAACRAFSAVTAAFQAFFAVWIGTAVLTPEWWWLPVAVMLLVMALAAAPYRSPRRVILVSMVVLLVSLACCAAYEVSGSAARSLSFARLHAPWQLQSEVWPLAAVCVLGFGLCPYLDLSFHHARQQLDRGASRAAFGAGFGLFFLAMIAFTVLYAGDFLGWLISQLIRRNPSEFDVRPAGAVLIGVHMFAQLGFTYMLHRRPPGAAHVPGDATASPRGDASRFEWGIVGVGIGLVAAVVLPAVEMKSHHGLVPAEIVYRCFMAFYGLVFPGYVWLCMLPTHDGHTGPRRDKMVVLGAAVVGAAPCYWMGFIERQTWWLAGGVAIVLLARLFVRGGWGFAPVRAVVKPTPPVLEGAAEA